MLRIAAAVVTDPDGRSLLVRKHGSTVFMQPGGKIESGESALTALTRELREELGLVVDPAETEYIGSYRAVAANEENTVVRAEVFFLMTPELPVAARRDRRTALGRAPRRDLGRGRPALARLAAAALGGAQLDPVLTAAIRASDIRAAAGPNVEWPTGTPGRAVC